MQQSHKYLLSVVWVITIFTAQSVIGLSINVADDLELMDAGHVAKTMDKEVVSVKCIAGDNWSKDLTLARLNAMIKTVLGTAYGSVYIFAPFCPNTEDSGHVYISGKGQHAEDWMVNYCGLTEVEFYLTSAPCPDCALMLKNAYGTGPKPTIFIARPYQGKGKSGNGNKKVNTDCLAMLAQAGFPLLPWDWDRLDTYVTQTDCKNTIQDNREALQGRKTIITDYLNEVNNMINDDTKDFENLCRNAIGG